MMDLDKIWYKSRPTQGALTHQISSWSDKKWPRNVAWSVSQGRRGPSNEVSKMNLFMAGGHSFWPRKLIFGYVVAQFNYPKSYYYTLLIQSSVWPRQGLKDDQSGPKYGVLLYFCVQVIEQRSHCSIITYITIMQYIESLNSLNITGQRIYAHDKIIRLRDFLQGISS